MRQTAFKNATRIDGKYIIKRVVNKIMKKVSSSKFMSRKFIVTLCAIVGILGCVISGDLPSGDAVNQIMGIVMAYLASQGFIDYKNGGKKK